MRFLKFYYVNLPFLTVFSQEPLDQEQEPAQFQKLITLSSAQALTLVKKIYKKRKREAYEISNIMPLSWCDPSALSCASLLCSLYKTFIQNKNTTSNQQHFKMIPGNNLLLKFVYIYDWCEMGVNSMKEKNNNSEWVCCALLH